LVCFSGTAGPATTPPVVVEPKTSELILTSGDVLVIICNGAAPLSWTYPVFPKVSIDYVLIFRYKVRTLMRTMSKEDRKYCN